MYLEEKWWITAIEIAISKTLDRTGNFKLSALNTYEDIFFSIQISNKL